jgi:hypothetical protein
MSRKVIVASPSVNRAKTFETCANTWGELKEELGSMYSDGLEAIVGTSRVSLTRDEAELPSGDFNLFLVAKKNKAGSDDSSVEIVKAIYTAIATGEEDDKENLIEILHEKIDEFFDAETSSSSSEERRALEEASRL